MEPKALTRDPAGPPIDGWASVDRRRVPRCSDQDRFGGPDPRRQRSRRACLRLGRGGGHRTGLRRDGLRCEAPRSADRSLPRQSDRKLDPASRCLAGQPSCRVPARRRVRGGDDDRAHARRVRIRLRGPLLRRDRRRPARGRRRALRGLRRIVRRRDLRLRARWGDHVLERQRRAHVRLHRSRGDRQADQHVRADRPDQPGRRVSARRSPGASESSTTRRRRWRETAG